MPEKQSLVKVFLKPGWVITVFIVIAFAYIAFTVLAPWQLGKNEATTARNEQITAAFEHEPVPYTPGLEEWRRVEITGTYQPEHETILRLRPVNSKPAYHSLIPFTIENGPTIILNRGYQTEAEGPSFAPPPSEPVTITAHIRRTETGVDPSITASLPPQVNGIDTKQLADITGLELEDDYLQLVEGQPGVIQALPLPQLETGPYLSYGIQWIAFGIMAPLGLGYFIYAEIRERRREEQENATAAEAERIDAPEPEPTPQRNDAPTTRRHHARYGNDRVDHYRKIAEKNQERF
ncbi:SURF1 family cytochrome oxidase biogenesis protein [Corynebacterium freiburgense]|uniref:SURF1 family cytochrome oxidase biogenesis protein n=1 Tax=Corynebacterium freiburgense TaxID=556548 RepID=UPI0004159924|nr:SURF1 family cytochrome oxidase biogenesis protein [Corynebacterium freiburgense]WJZ03239.1 SURF1 family protein [Corynebacterium freiburgense]